MFTWHWQLFNTSLLLNNHAKFQNIHGEEMSPIKKVMTQYVQVMLNLCLTVYDIIRIHTSVKCLEVRQCFNCYIVSEKTIDSWKLHHLISFRL